MKKAEVTPQFNGVKVTFSGDIATCIPEELYL